MSAKSWTHMLPRKAFFESLCRSQYTGRAGPDFLASASASVVSPRRRVVANSDTVRQTFAGDEALAGLSDESILSLFTAGFFGGFVFGLEGLLSRAGAWRLLPVHFSTFQTVSGTTAPNNIWKSSDIPRLELCSPGTTLFGIFQLIEKRIFDTRLSSSDATTTTTSYVDYAFGSDQYSFAGCHRFSITRPFPPSPTTRVEPTQTQPTPPQQIRTRISLEGFTCNPQREKQSMPAIGTWFHSRYAKALFANGIQAVLDR
ncbi:hypothetical protein N3K66_003796 [Trichothecium roseum]|uniref:Uncharacterized protein n=1 Tax=Trichothecium roseum TaxID=47278 RepID=A0ACC0V7Z9_9HYPO|nr:hypothetical protein N3K66_003796 [Trichothecium roseum]